jgi:hypothetical protein
MNYSKGSNSMYQDHDNGLHETERKPIKKKTLELKIANCRGKKPVLRDIKKARDIISGLLIEINDCKAKTKLKEIDSTLWAIMHEND